MRFRTLLLFLIVPLLSVDAIHFRHIDMDNGLSQLSVMSIYKDQLGRMWFGTEDGINIYDGNRMKVYRSYMSGKLKTGLSAQVIDGDNKGHVFSSSGSDLLRYDLYTEKFTCLIPSGVSTFTYYKGKIYYGLRGRIMSMDYTGAKKRTYCRFSRSMYSNDIKFDSRQNCWIATNKGLYVFTKEGKMLCALPNENVVYLFEDSRNNIWASTHNNGCFMKMPGGSFVHFIASQGGLTSNMTRKMAEDKNGNIWIGTFLGLNKYDIRTGQFSSYVHTNNPYSISHSSVFPVYCDKQGTVWVGTYYGGVNYFNPNRDIITYYSPDDEAGISLSAPFVGHMVEDKRGDLWICTEGGGLNRLNRQTGQITHYMASPNPNSIAHNNLKCISYDANRDRLYIGTYTQGISIYDIRQDKFINLYRIHSDYSNLYGDQIFNMSIYGNHLIFTTPNGLWKMDLDNLTIKPLFASGHFYGNSYFHVDREGYIWISAFYGIYRIRLDKESDWKFYRCGEKGLGNYQFTDIDVGEDSKGRIYAVLFGDGLFEFDKASDTFRAYNQSNSNILSDYCYEVQSFGNYLLINTDKGFCLFNTNKKTFWNIELSSDLPITGIHRGCGVYACRDNEIFVGGINGMISFNIGMIHNFDNNYQLYMSNLYINNNEVLPGDETGILDKAFCYTHKIVLSHNQNDITVYFTTNNYIGFYRHPLYEYRLEGYDKHWIQTDETRIIYTKLPPGKYTLVVREKLWQSSQNGHVYKLDIVVKPPFYKTGLAYLLYFLIFAGLLYSFYHFKRSHMLLKLSLQQEKFEKQNIEKMNKAKLQFFTNISHEFRTPLTLLITKLDTITEEQSSNTALSRKLRSLSGNANHLLKLINELLDFRKMEQDHIKLNVKNNDVVDFAKNIYSDFVEVANQKGIKYEFSSSQPSIMCWFDGIQMEKVVFNLLSNTFKFVRKNKGAIDLIVSSEGDNVLIKVFDNGIGINQKDINKIFDRFYQAESGNAVNISTPGTGIGLALVKEIVSLHHGEVNVESQLGYGSLFTIKLLKGNSHFSEEELLSDKSSLLGDVPADEQAADGQQKTDDDDSKSPSIKDKRCKILLVEDNEELLLTLKDLFVKTYDVEIAHDGREGLSSVRRFLPDIVVSDVMMPVMDGIQMCKTIKDDVTVCHIPVILLTAMATTEQEINGFKCGADEYITKPFNPQLLLVKCNSIIRSRIILKKKFADDINSDSKLLATNSYDQKFLSDCDNAINDNIDNPDFSVDNLAQAVSMGRTKFFNKFKTLTGMSPNDYILNCRIKISSAWLKQRQSMQISEIAYALGFNSSHYFSQRFKKKYGVTPTEFREGATSPNDGE